MSIVEHRSIHPTYIYDIDDRFGTLDDVILLLITITILFSDELLLFFTQIIDNLRMAAITQQYIFTASSLVGVLGEG